MDRAHAGKTPDKATSGDQRVRASEEAPTVPALWLQRLPAGTTSPAQPQPAAGAQIPPTAPAAGSAPVAGATPALLVDDGETAAPGQLHKSTFLSALEASLPAALSEVLADTGFSPTDCPVIAYWLSYYRGRSAADVERALKLYTGVGQVPSADAYVSIAVARVLAGAIVWKTSGDVAMPSEAASAPGAEGEAAEEPVMALRGEPAPAKSGDPKTIQRSLGTGQPLHAGVRQGMESGFGADFSSVRLHNDARAGRIANDLGAHAFAVGDHVAFAPGVYAPGSLVGDLVLAHELAHTLQQSGRTGTLPSRSLDGAEESGLETAADVAAAQAVLRIRAKRGESIPEDALGVHEAALSEVRSAGSAHPGLRLDRCSKDKKQPQAQAPKPWWEQVPEEQQGSKGDLFFRPITDAQPLRDLLRQVDMIVTFDTSKSVLKKAPGKKRSEAFVPGTIAATQWTNAEVKKEIDAILPPGGGTIVTTKHIGSVKTVVDAYRKKHPDSFSMLQGVEAVNCAATGACIGTMNKLVEKLYGPSAIKTKDMDDTAFGTIDKLTKEKRIAGEKTFAATYSGDKGNFVISNPPAELTLSGAGQWVLDTANGGSAGVHMFIMSLANGYHSVSLAVANEGGSAAQIVWKDQHGTKVFDAAGLDDKIRLNCWGRYVTWLVVQYNKDHPDAKVKDSTEIPADALPDLRKKVKSSVLNDIAQTRIAHLNPSPK
jgi:Domain of unknown function (DUF4157)